MGQFATVQYIKAEHISAAERIERGLPSTGFIKKVIKYGSVITEMMYVEDPVKDILDSMSSLKSDFTSLEEGELSDVEQKK